MKEKESKAFNQIRDYALKVAWPYEIGYEQCYYSFEEIREIELIEEEMCYIASGWHVVFYNEIVLSPDYEEEENGYLDCFIAIFKTGEIGFFRKTKEQWLEEAIIHYKAKQYKSTIFACDQILKLDAKNVRAYHGKGLSLLKLSGSEEALVIYEEMMKITHNNSEIYYEAGSILYNLRRYEEALIAYNQALKLNSRNEKAYLEKGCTLLELKRYKEALTVCKKAVQLNPSNIDDYKAWISKLQYIGEYKEALIICAQLVTLMPNDAELHYYQGILFFKLTNLEKALLAIKKAILINPTGYAYCVYGDILLDLKCYEEALASYERSILFIDDNIYHKHRYPNFDIKALSRYQKIVLIYQSFLEFEEYNYDDQITYNKFGNLLYKLELYEEALVIYEEAHSLDARSYYEKGCILFNFHHYEKALMAFTKSINLDVSNADAWRIKGDILRLLKRPDASFIHYEVAKIVADWNGDVYELQNLISQVAEAYTKNII